MLKNTLLLALAASAAAIPGVAQAQRLPAAVIGVVDSNRVYAECTACRAARTQLQTQATALQTRQQTLSNQLKPEADAIQAALKALGNKQPDQALRTRVQAFQQREQQANQELAQGQQRLQSTQANVLRQINERMNPIISQVMTARGASVVVDKDATLAYSPSVDVTNDVLARLNSALPSVSVTPMTQQQQQQPQGR